MPRVCFAPRRVHLSATFCGLCALAASLGACDRASNEFVAPPPPAVTVATPQVQEITRFLESPGRLEALESVEIRARVRGYLESVEFEPGLEVEQGDLLFTIERDQFEAELKSAQGRLAQSRAALTLMEATLERVQRAAAQDAASDLEVLEAEANQEAAAGSVVESEAMVREAELNLSYTQIETPVTGRVNRELVDAGNLVGANEATLLTTVLSYDPIHVYFNINERDLLQLVEENGRDSDRRDEVDVLLTLADGRDHDGIGRIDFVSNTVDPNTGTIELRAVFDNADNELFPGFFARVRVTRSTGQAMLVPPEIVGRDVAGSYVLVVNDENIVERRGVTTGPLVPEGRVIEAGLEATDRVIVNGWQRARPGAPVSPTEQAGE